MKAYRILIFIGAILLLLTLVACGPATAPRGAPVPMATAPTKALAPAVSPKGDQGTEIVWSAEADFESGIGGFIVLRDGQELAKVPETPVGKFGRPLFQAMTYHDTPAQPLPEMRYVDASAKAGEKHAYAVIAVNSVGLRSKPSAAASMRCS
jgi:hypothetical protein